MCKVYKHFVRYGKVNTLTSRNSTQDKRARTFEEWLVGIFGRFGVVVAIHYINFLLVFFNFFFVSLRFVCAFESRTNMPKRTEFDSCVVPAHTHTHTLCVERQK